MFKGQKSKYGNKIIYIINSYVKLVLFEFRVKLLENNEDENTAEEWHIPRVYIIVFMTYTDMYDTQRLL